MNAKLKSMLKNKVLKTLFWSSVGLSAVACGERVPNFKMLSRTQGFMSSGVTNNKVDILWVIDNSGTMGPKQDNLRTSINSFMSQFVTKGMDYRIAVVTTDIRAVDPAAPNDPNVSGQAACFVASGANPQIITPSTPDATTKLGENADVGFFGSADAHGLDAVELALSEPNLSGCNAGFLRDDAFLAVIEFSDADDNTAATVNGLLTFLDGLKPPVSTPNGGSVRSYFASAMIVEDLTRQECIDLGPFSEVGTKFIDLATQTGGSIASICDTDFSAGLLSVSTKILEATTAVRLQYEPQAGTIIVFQNLTLVPEDATNGWTFDAATNRVVFHGTAIPSAGVQIYIDYTPKDIIR